MVSLPFYWKCCFVSLSLHFCIAHNTQNLFSPTHHPKWTNVLHKHCFQCLLSSTIVPKVTENQCKIRGKQTKCKALNDPGRERFKPPMFERHLVNERVSVYSMAFADVIRWKLLKTSLVPRRSRLGQSWTLSWAVTSPRDTPRERLANIARSNMAAVSSGYCNFSQR